MQETELSDVVSDKVPELRGRVTTFSEGRSKGIQLVLAKRVEHVA